MTSTPAISIEEIEQILSELDQLAHGNGRTGDFYDQLLSRYQNLVQATHVAIVSSVPNRKPFLRIGSHGISHKDVLDLVDRLMSEDTVLSDTDSANKKLSNRESNFLVHHVGSRSYVANATRSKEDSQEILVAAFDGIVDVATHPALRELGLAFCDLLDMRSSYRLERFFSKDWPRWCRVSDGIARALTLKPSAQILVDGILPIFEANRVSLSSSSVWNSRKTVLAISGVTNFAVTNPSISQMGRIASRASQSKSIISSQLATKLDSVGDEEQDGSGMLRHWIAIPIAEIQDQAIRSVIVLEWTDRNAMLDAGPPLAALIPPMATVWNQQTRWLAMPSLLRRFFACGNQFSLSRSLLPTMRRIGAALILAALFFVAIKPTTIILEASASLEPEERRPVHAPADGIVKSILVHDADQVREGDGLLELYSPNLEIQIEQVRGEIAETLEKRNGLNATLSQLASNQKEDPSNRVRLSTEIAINQTQEKLLKEKLRFLISERSRLKILAPITGQVISRNLQRELAGRPVTHGDQLLTIANLESQWQLQVRVSDQDALLLRNRFKKGDASAQVVLDNLPDRSFEGKVIRVGLAMEAEYGLGTFLPVVVAVDGEVASHASIGAGAKVVFRCGKEPTWYVWTRPLVDFARRKIWLYFPGTNR